MNPFLKISRPVPAGVSSSTMSDGISMLPSLRCRTAPNGRPNF